MKSFKQKTILNSFRPVLAGMEKMHPYRIMIFILIGIFCLIYAAFTFFFVRYLAMVLQGNYQYDLPDAYFIGTIILVGTAHLSTNVVRAFVQEDIPALRRNLVMMMISGGLYMATQIIAWIGIFIHKAENPADFIPDYLLLFSSWHFAQVGAAIVMASKGYYDFRMVEKDPVELLIMTTNPHEKAKLEVYEIYWKFVVYSWVGIVVLMLIVF